MILTLDEAKEYLKVEHNDEDILIQGLIVAAENYIKNATGIEFDNTNELAKLAVRLLIVNWYENREINTDKANKLAFSLDVILTQLKYCYGSDTV